MFRIFIYILKILNFSFTTPPAKIADFYCAEAKLVIELDGSGHYTEEGKQYDEERTAFLEEYGLTVIRIPNTEIHKNFRGVCEYIDHLVEQSLSQLR